jgi:radical SAM protein with 4Fe4S-binding SPASM domain
MRGYSGTNIYNTVDLLIENDIKPSFKATLSLDNLKLLPQIWLSYYDLYKKYNHVQYSPTLDTTSSDITYLTDWHNSLKEIIKYELAFLKQNSYPLWSWFKESTKINCLTSNRLHIHNDGNIYICHGCPYIKNNKKFIIGNTNNNKLKDLFVENDEKQTNKTCETCEATYCSVCHINNIDENSGNYMDVYDSWVKCRQKNENKCKYYKIFAKYSRVLKTAYRIG